MSFELRLFSTHFNILEDKGLKAGIDEIEEKLTCVKG
jgi:hypothetical protein